VRRMVDDPKVGALVGTEGLSDHVGCRPLIIAPM
jgi:hypothetical protein